MSLWSSLLGALSFGSRIEKVSAQDADRLSREGRLIIIDVRDPEEWEASGTPRGSHRVSMTAGNFVDTVDLLVTAEPETTIAISCQTGIRSRSAIKKLRRSLPLDFRILQGGLDAWIAAGLPLDRP